MPTQNAHAALSQSIQHLLEQRQHHADALATIDSTLERVGAAIGTVPARRGRPPGPVTAQVPAVKGKRRRRGKFATSANDSILAFVKANKNPTTQEIKRHWASEGRKGGADNTLSLLTKDKKLKRTPLGKGIRGSRFALA